MKRELILLAAALLVASALFAYPALSTPTTPSASINARMRALEAKANMLDAKVRALQNGQRSTAAKVASLDACLSTAVTELFGPAAMHATAEPRS